MEPHEGDIKPVIPTNDTPDKSSLASLGTGKLKQSRYEDVWPEDVHAAFMEAVALYPPMGKRRLKYYRVATHENGSQSDANRAKSFGRCQLIQSYILEKTGKNRSRKQVSSHLQRLKKIHKDNPAMRPLFSERSEPPSELRSAPQAVAMSSQDTLANISFSTRHLKSNFDFTVNLQNTDTDADSPSMSSYPLDASFLNDSSYNVPTLSPSFHSQSSFFIPQEFPSPKQHAASILHPSDDPYLSELQDPFLFKNAFRAGSAINASAFSISMRRFVSKLPVAGRQVDPGSTTHFSHPIHSLGSQSAHQRISQDDLTDDTSYIPAFAPVQQAFHMPFHPHQLIPPEKQRLGSGIASEWMWPQSPGLPVGPREGTFGEVHFRYPPTAYPCNTTCSVDSPGAHDSPDSEVLRLPRLSYSYATTSPAAVSENIPSENVIDFLGQSSPGSPENPGSPLVIRPTPVYPISYIHSKIYSDVHTPAPSLWSLLS